MIKPDVMDGVPKEEGYYFRKPKDGSIFGWIPTKVWKEDRHGEEVLGFTVEKFVIVDQEDFGNYTWSERMASPDVDK